MLGLQMLVEVPDWAREHGLDEVSFNILEQCVLSPGLKEKILKNVEEDTRCCIETALRYASDKGLLED